MLRRRLRTSWFQPPGGDASLPSYARWPLRRWCESAAVRSSCHPRGRDHVVRLARPLPSRGWSLGRLRIVQVPSAWLRRFVHLARPVVVKYMLNVRSAPSLSFPCGCDDSFTSHVRWPSRTCSLAASLSSSSHARGCLRAVLVLYPWLPRSRLRRASVAVEEILPSRLRTILVPCPWLPPCRPRPIPLAATISFASRIGGRRGASPEPPPYHPRPICAAATIRSRISGPGVEDGGQDKGVVPNGRKRWMGIMIFGDK